MMGLNMVLGIKSRGQPRAKIKLPVEIQTTCGSISGETHNISTSGAFICCQHPLCLRDNFQITIEVPHRQELTMMARVVWKTVGTPNDTARGSGFGVHFSQITPHDRKLLHNFISHHTQKKFTNP
jgi:Tfp pilus assembly protein PilZ